MKIVFMGTPNFARIVMSKLLSSTHEIVAVYTKQRSEVAKLADSCNIAVRTPSSLHNYPMELADVGVVVAYGLLIPQAILSHFRYGCINVHPSVLPRWRGAAPVERAIISGDCETGVSIMQLDQGLDTGDVLKTLSTNIFDDDTGESLSVRLANMGAAALVEVLDSINDLRPVKQNDSLATYAHKISTADERIDWNESGVVIERKIRALFPSPCTYVTIADNRIKIISAVFVPCSHINAPGTIINGNFDIATIDGYIRPLCVQRNGSARMPTSDFLRGFKIVSGMVLE